MRSRIWSAMAATADSSSRSVRHVPSTDTPPICQLAWAGRYCGGLRSSTTSPAWAPLSSASAQFSSAAMADAAPARPRVTVAIVSWNTRELLSRCLASLRQDVDARRAGVWVVDNGSDDGSAEAVRNGAPWAHLLQPGRNLGFGAAVNLVAAQSDSEWLACANADVAL